MNLRATLPAFAKHLAARGAAPRTLAAYDRTVAAFLDAIGGNGTASRADVETFLARPRRDGQPRRASTKRAELNALRAFFAFVAEQGVVADPTDGIAVKRERPSAPAVAMPADLAPLYKAASSSARDSAILGLFHVLGLRVHELAGLDVAQLDLTAHVLRRVRGKGATLTDFPLPAPLAALLVGWLRERAMAGHSDGPLFPTARPSASTTGRLSVRSLQRLVGRLAEDAGLGRRLGPHALRHGCATAAISLGIDVPTTAEVMRHASIATTQSYVHLARDARREALEKIASLIPPSVVPAAGPAEQKPAEKPPAAGAAGAVDIHPVVDGDRAPLGRSDAA